MCKTMIELHSTLSGKRICVIAHKIQQVVEREDGCHVFMDNKDEYYVEESYEIVTNKLAELCYGTS